MDKMYQAIILLVVTTSSVLARAGLGDQDVLLTEKTDEAPDVSALARLDNGMDENKDIETLSEDVDVTVARLTAKLNDIESKVKNIELLQKFHDSNDIKSYKTVAFHAVNTGGGYYYGVKQILQFNEVLLNEGKGFNSHHSIFIAPRPGVYLFSSSILSGASVLFAADIVVNDERKVLLYGKGHGGYHDQGSNTFVTRLQQGDTVAVKLACCGNTQLYGGYYSSFTGVLLQV